MLIKHQYIIFFNIKFKKDKKIAKVKSKQVEIYSVSLQKNFKKRNFNLNKRQRYGKDAICVLNQGGI